MTVEREKEKKSMIIVAPSCLKDADGAHTRSDQFSNNMGWDTQRGRISPVDVSGTDILTCSLDNTSGVGDERYPGVTVEGEGEVVPETDYMRNERSQASKKVMMQLLYGTRDLEEGSELGSITAEVGEACQLEERESSFAPAL